VCNDKINDFLSAEMANGFSAEEEVERYKSGEVFLSFFFFFFAPAFDVSRVHSPSVILPIGEDRAGWLSTEELVLKRLRGRQNVLRVPDGCFLIGVDCGSFRNLVESSEL